MPETIWRDPPTIIRRRRQTTHEQFAHDLTLNPGRWAVLEGINATATKQINEGTWPEFAPAGEFEAVSRASEDGGKPDVYVRYLGPEVSDSSDEVPISVDYL